MDDAWLVATGFVIGVVASLIPLGVLALELWKRRRRRE